MENVFVDTYAWVEAVEKLPHEERGRLMDAATLFFRSLPGVQAPIEIRVGGYAVFMSKPKPERGK